VRHSRAALSICANIAEGAGELSGDAKASFYRIACRSATECAAILDAKKKIGIADDNLVTGGAAKLLRIVAMLIKLSKRHRSA
jgi:four helix bundle protein